VTRDLTLKYLTILCALISLIALGACTVAGSTQTRPPSTGSEPAEAIGADTPSEAESDDHEQDELQSTQHDNPPDLPEPASESDDSPASEEAVDPDAQAGAESDDTAADDPRAGRPVELRIEKIDVTARFEYVGVTPEGNMDAPRGWNNVAWYQPGAVPGSRGSAVIAGHYDAPHGPAIFYRLNRLEPGDRITITTEHREELVFEVTETEVVHVDDAPLDRIFGRTDDRNLNLITCDGIWDHGVGMYDKRLIVYSTLVED
jgi:sortase A